MPRSLLFFILLLGFVSMCLPVLYGIPQCHEPVNFQVCTDLKPYLPEKRGEIPVLINFSISATRKELDLLANVNDTERSVNNTLLRIEEIMTRFDDDTLSLLFIAEECEDPVISAEARESREERNRFLNEIYLRPDLADSLSGLSPSNKTEQKLLTKHTMNFLPALLPSESRLELTNLGENLSLLEAEYRKNQEEGTALANLLLIPDIVQIRQDIVKRIGYQTFADYQIAQSGLSTDADNLSLWLYANASPFICLSHAEAENLLKIKSMADPYATGVKDFEIVSLRKKMVALSPDGCLIVKPDVFRFSDVLEGTIRFFSRFFLLDIIMVRQIPGYSDHLSLYLIEEPVSRTPRGWFYLGYSLSNVSETRGKTYYLRSGRFSDNEWIPPVSAVILQIPSDASGKDPSIRAADIHILFHEMGHMLRHNLALGRYASLSSEVYGDSAYGEVMPLVFEKLVAFPEVYSAVTGQKTGDLGICDNKDIGMTSYDRDWGIGFSRAYTYLVSQIDLSLSSGNYQILDSYPSLFQNVTGYQSGTGGAELLDNPAFFIGNQGIYWHYSFDEIQAGKIIGELFPDSRFDYLAGIRLRDEYLEPSRFT